MYDTLEGQVEVAKSRWSSSAMSSPLAGITPRSCWAVAKGLDTSIWAMSNKAMMFICSAYQKDVYEMYKKHSGVYFIVVKIAIFCYLPMTRCIQMLRL
jgi:hypothetical protein